MSTTAFPVSALVYNEDNKDPTTIIHDGMTLRDYFAAKAMQSAFNEGNFTFTLEDYRHLAKVAYAVADAMLAERMKEE